MTGTNVTALEVGWTACMVASFIVSVVSLGWVGWKYHIYRTPDPVTGKRPNGMGQMLVIRDAMLYVMLIIFTFSETMFGLFAMTVPSPDNHDTPEQEALYGLLTMSVAVLIVVFSIANLWIGIVAFNRRGDE